MECILQKYADTFAAGRIILNLQTKSELLRRNFYVEKRFIGFLAAAFMLLCFFCVPAFAAEPEFDISDYSIYDLQEMTTKEKAILMSAIAMRMAFENAGVLLAL